MKTIDITSSGGLQTVHLPEEFRFSVDRVTIRREGEAIILEPLKANEWPPDFFERIHIADPKFVRPDQGEMPPAPSFGDS